MSSLLSRFETVITATIVIAIAVSALVTDPLRGGSIYLCVPARDGDAPLPRFEELRGRLARALDHPVRVHLRKGAPGDECELAVVSVHDWRQIGKGAELEPVAVVEGARAAVVIAGMDGPQELAQLPAAGILFTAPHSLNGCWIQLASLRRSGVATPERIDALRFAPAPGMAERVIFEVALGRAPAGAVPGDVLDVMMSDGLIQEGEVRVIDIAPGVPEVLLCRQRGKGPGVDGLIREGLRPVTPGDLERVEELFRMAGAMGWE